MKLINRIKKIAVVSFLIIVIPGPHISLFNFLNIFIVGVVNNFMELFYFDDFIYHFTFLLFNVFVGLSVFSLFNTKNKWLISSFSILYLQIIFNFKIEYLFFWYYTIPLILFISASLCLFYLKLKYKNE